MHIYIYIYLYIYISISIYIYTCIYIYVINISNIRIEYRNIEYINDKQFLEWVLITNRLHKFLKIKKLKKKNSCNLKVMMIITIATLNLEIGLKKEEVKKESNSFS